MKKIISMLMAGVLIVCCIMSVSATDISDLEQQKSEVQAQKEKDEAKLQQQNAAVDKKQGEIDKINAQIESVSKEIRTCYTKIIGLNKDISTKQTQINAAKKKIEENMDVLRQRLKAIYIAGDVSSLEIITGAKDFGDFLDKLQLVQYVSNHDEKLINRIKKQLNAIAKEKKALEKDKKELVTQQSTLKTKQGELNTILDENKEVLASLQTKVDETKMDISISEEQLSSLDSRLQEEYRKQREAQEAAAAAAAASNSESSGGESSGGGSAYIDPGAATQVESSGAWTWPTPGAYTITSPFNESRSYETHGGIDIGAAMGTPIYAAGAGQVVASYNGCNHVSSGGNWCSCGGGYGNYVQIMHNNGYETIYGHMTATAVSTGQTVSKGQLIGYVGSSGWSTGAHLHFELRIGGVKSNPLNLF